MARVDVEIEDDLVQKVLEYMKEKTSTRKDSNAAAARFAFQLAMQRIERLEDQEQELAQDFKEMKKNLQEAAEEL